MNIVKKCSDLCNKDPCFPKDTRKMFSSFDFTPDGEGSLKPLVEKFYGNAENYYSNFYSSLQGSLLSKKFADVITLT